MIDGYEINLTSYIRAGKYASSLISELLLTYNKTMAKTDLTKKYELFSQKINFLGSVKITNMEILKILAAFELIDINENVHNILWIGPHCFNIMGINQMSLREHPYIKNSLTEALHNFDQRYPYELTIRESSFFHKMYDEFSNDLKNSVNRRWFSHSSEDYQEYSKPVSNLFGQFGFAMIKSANICYYLKKTYVIIGRKSSSPGQRYEWEVDLNLEGNPMVSKQHAVIAYNFERGQFEVFCVSRKNPIKVNKMVLKFGDTPCPLHDESSIKIGGQTLYFLLPSVVN